MVLCSGSWPLTVSTQEFNIPAEVILLNQVLGYYERFSGFYANKHQGRKLNWLMQLCKGELKTTYLSQAYVLQVSTYQMTILLCYNNQTNFSFEELLGITGMSRDLLEPNLHLLLKAKILIHEGSYLLNSNFKSKKLRINLNVAVKSESKTETNETLKTVEKDRELVIQAAIVRIMKTRKVLKHVQLMQEVITQVQGRFQPSVQQIKKSIDVLLEKEYIERVEGQKDMFSYVA
jgi:cullin 1